MGDVHGMGFISNRGPERAKQLLGGTSNPSRKGPFSLGTHSRMSTPTAPQSSDQRSQSHLPLSATSNEVFQKRIEYVENQEKRIAAKMFEDNHRQSQQMGHITEETEKLKTQQATSQQQTKLLYNDMQWVYGKCCSDIVGLDVGEKLYEGLQRYSLSSDESKKKTMTQRGSWIMLMHPMERVDLPGERYELLMKHKTVDPDTGQLKITWVVVFESAKGHEKCHIEKWSLLPRSN